MISLSLETIVSVSLAKKTCIQQSFTAARRSLIYNQKICGNSNEPYVTPPCTLSQLKQAPLCIRLYDNFYKQVLDMIQTSAHICI